MSDENLDFTESEHQNLADTNIEKCEVLEPLTKKIKPVLSIEKNEKLEQRLNEILCCAVCLDLPSAAVYQCCNGHLMCAGCITHLLADARLRNELAKCPTCRVEFSKQSASRNLAVEKAVSELPIECQFCNKELPRNVLETHEKLSCEKRIGCAWRGPKYEYVQHENICVYPHKTGAEVMEALKLYEEKNEEEKELYDQLFDLLSCEKIAINDLQMKPYRTDDIFHILFYETNCFSAFNQQWVVKTRINSFQSNPTQSSERDMTYQLIMKSKPTFQMTIHYLIVKGPFGDMKVKPNVYKFDFTIDECETPFNHLPLQDTPECNRLLAAKAINFRYF